MVEESEEGVPRPLPLLQVRQSSYAKFAAGGDLRPITQAAPSTPEVPVGDLEELIQQRWKRVGYAPDEEDPRTELSERGTWSGTPFSSDMLPSDLHLDLSEVVETRGYDSQSSSSRLPLRLQGILAEPKGSITWLALSGVSIIGYPKNGISDALARLRAYLKTSIAMGWLDESAYLTEILENIRVEREEMQRIEETEPPEAIDERLELAQTALDSGMQEWGNKRVLVDSEEELALRSLELKYEQEQSRLEKTWNSAKMRARFNKPSPTLLEKRSTVRRMLTVHRFNEAARLANEIEELEKFECAEAAAQMRRGYRAACERLEKQFLNDKDSLLGGFATKRNLVERGKTQSLLPLGRRVAKCTQQKESFLENQRRNPPARSRTPSLASRSTLRSETTIGTVSEKLKLPVLKSHKRQQSRTTVCRMNSSFSRRNPGSNVATGRESRLGNYYSISDSDEEDPW
jgi:hypothetical protein